MNQFSTDSYLCGSWDSFCLLPDALCYSFAITLRLDGWEDMPGTGGTCSYTVLKEGGRRGCTGHFSAHPLPPLFSTLLWWEEMPFADTACLCYPHARAVTCTYYTYSSVLLLPSTPTSCVSLVSCDRPPYSLFLCSLHLVSLLRACLASAVPSCFCNRLAPSSLAIAMSYCRSVCLLPTLPTSPTVQFIQMLLPMPV